MKKAALIATLAAVVAGPALANADLAQKKNCMACHATDKKLVGPAYKEVAAKYAGQKDAVAKLTDKVMKGGSGVWGQVPMPANPQILQGCFQRQRLCLSVCHQFGPLHLGRSKRRFLCASVQCRRLVRHGATLTVGTQHHDWNCRVNKRGRLGRGRNLVVSSKRNRHRRAV